MALHVVRGLSDEARAVFVSEVARPERAPAVARRPGPVKCAASPFSEARGYATQLGLFARSVARVR